MPVAPSLGQIRSHVAAVLRRQPEARAVAIHHSGTWAGPASLQVGDTAVDVTWCPSSLAVREALASRAETSPPLVLLTDRPERELGADVLARLFKRRVLRLDPWQVLADVFRAVRVDPRLGQHRWLAEALIEFAPVEGYPPVPMGLLDWETAWSRLYEALFGIQGGISELDALLEWTEDRQRVGTFLAAAEETRNRVATQLSEAVSPAVAPILALATSGRIGDAVPLGLVVGALMVAHAQGDGAARDGLIRIEPWVGGQSLDLPVTQPWAESAQRLARRRLERDGYATTQPLLERADALLAELRAESVAWASDLLPRGLELRLTRVGAALSELLGRPSPAAVTKLSLAMTHAREHRLLVERPERARAVEMAARLMRWLGAQEGGAEAGSLRQAVLKYASDGGHADWARTCVAGGEGARELARAYGALLARAGAARERESQTFARLLGDWLGVGSSLAGVVPLEQMLDSIVAPLAQAGPVLLVVLDGMSQAVFAELSEDLLRRGWVEVGPGPDGPLAGLAVLPTVTEVSRTSLLCGRLTTGGQAEERAAFAAHPGLVRASKATHPPVLFHKSEVLDPATGNLSKVLRDALESRDQRVVGVVLNAIDDFLLRGDQILPSWTADYVRPLPWLLDAASAAARRMVLTADHGHVLDRGMEQRGEGASGERFRTDAAAPGEGEIALSGPRVLAPGQRIVAPWSERIRYGSRKNGYHGGAAPQEVVVPLAVLVPAHAGAPPEGWSFLPARTPSWWEDGGAEKQALAAAPPAAPAPKAKGQLTLPVATAEALEFEWIERLLASSAYLSQKRLGGRLVPDDAQVREVLVAIAKRGGRVTRAALARDLALPEIRLQSLLSALRRLLNLDGYAVLLLDEASGTVILERALLEAQFLGAS